MVLPLAESERRRRKKKRRTCQFLKQRQQQQPGTTFGSAQIGDIIVRWLFSLPFTFRPEILLFSPKYNKLSRDWFLVGFSLVVD